MNKRLYPKLAAQNLIKNGKFYFPYLLTVIGSTAAFYIVLALASAPVNSDMVRYEYLSLFMFIGIFVLGLFSIIFIFYTNSFLMKRRMKELGLYNILGMSKRNIGSILALESLYVWLIGGIGGVLVGMLLQKLMMMLVTKLMRVGAMYEFAVYPQVIIITLAFFGAILFLTFLNNLRRLHLQKPIELLRDNDAGEKEPKTKWLLTILGILTLGAGYAIAVKTDNAMIAIGVYFIAVFLVIIGTYLLFSAVSIFILKALRKNKGFYYKTGNFISVSGMLHRMNRNAIGLANICILSTMVLVMISATLALYIGTDDAINARNPFDITLEISYDAVDNTVPYDKLSSDIVKTIENKGYETERVCTYKRLEFAMDAGEIPQGYTHRGEGSVSSSNNIAFLRLYSSEDYAAISGKTVSLAPGEIIVTKGESGRVIPIVFGSGENETRFDFVVREVDEAFIDPELDVNLSYNTTNIVLADDTRFMDIAKAFANAQNNDSEVIIQYYARCYVGVDVDAPNEEIVSLAAYLSNPENVEGGMRYDGFSYEWYGVSNKAEAITDTYAINGGFFFLGVFLGIIFIMAMVLIMYYKQISEGYDDRRRFVIMQQVGLPRSEIKRSINVQILIVFFAPLLVAGVHIIFDFNMVRLMLQLFGLMNGRITLWCTLGTFGVFTLLYAGVYLLTAKVYYRIVSE